MTTKTHSLSLSASIPIARWAAFIAVSAVMFAALEPSFLAMRSFDSHMRSAISNFVSSAPSWFRS